MHRIMYMASVHMLIILHNWSNSLGSPSLALPGFLIVYLSSLPQKSPRLFPLTWLPSGSHGRENQQCVTNRDPVVCRRGARRGGVLMHSCACVHAEARGTHEMSSSVLSQFWDRVKITASGARGSRCLPGTEMREGPHQRLYVSSENLCSKLFVN